MTQSIVMDSVESSQIEAIGYAADTQTLAIQFKGKGGKPGSLYHYSNVTDEDWTAFSTAESIGSHFYKHIKPLSDKYPYVRIEPAHQTEQA
jgi:hypothetical protein